MICFSQKDITMDQNYPFSYVIFFFHQKQYKFRVCVFIHVMEERKKMFFCNNGKWHLKEKGKRKDLENNTMEVDLVCG